MDTPRFHLEKYHTPGSRHTCPQCGRRRCFTLYIDSLTGRPLDPSCGKCDHLSSCGYHLPPREYFRQGGRRPDTPLDPPTQQEPQRQPLVTLLPSEMPASLMGRETLLHSWLSRRFGADVARRTAWLYYLGQWHDHRTILWQVDERGRVHDGKLIDFLPNGHRSRQRPPSWVLSELRSQGRYPREAVSQKCLFGQHLLASTPAGVPVVLVESERSALYLASRYQAAPNLFLATGGCQALKPELLRPLRGRRLIVWPDAGMHDQWQAILRQARGGDYLLHNLDHLPPNTDLVDVLEAEDTAPAMP